MASDFVAVLDQFSKNIQVFRDLLEDKHIKENTEAFKYKEEITTQKLQQLAAVISDLTTKCN